MNGTSLILGILAVEALIILWLFWKHLIVPRGLVQRLKSVNVQDLKGTVFPHPIQDVLQNRSLERYKSWQSGRPEGNCASLEPLGDVFLEEDFYAPRKVNAAPGIMAGMGILGTFLGLALGLGNLDITTSSRLMAGIQVLLNGLSMAAWSSVLGIAGSLLFTFWSRRVTHDIKVQCDRINQGLAGEYPVITPGQAVRQLLDAQGQILSSVQSIQTDFIMELADVLVEKMEEGQRKFQSEIANGLSSGMLAGVQGVLGEFSGTLEKVLDSVVPLAQQTRELVAAVNAVIDRQQPVMNKLEQILPNLTDSVAQLAAITEEFSLVSEKVTKLVEANSATSEKVSEATEHVREATDSISSSLKTVAEMQPALATLTERFDNSLDRFARQTDQRLAETFTTFDKQLASVASKLVTVVDELADALDQLPPAAQQLCQAVKEQGLRDTVMDGASVLESEMARGGDR